MLLPNMNIPNFSNNNYNCICCNPTYNYPLAMNVPNGFGPNQNMNITGLHSGGNSNWQSIYNTKQQNQNLDINTAKLNAIFTTTRGMKIIINIDLNKKVSELIEIYFLRVEKPELLNRPKDICFIFNANKIDFKEQKTVYNYFKSTQARITVNDTKGLIGAH